jgi:glycosyltransferase involved in cell wall biosynthesis
VVEMIKIGYIHNGYNEVRNILSVKSNNIVHSKVIDVFKLRDYIRFKLSHQNNFYLHNSFNDRFSYPKAEVYHFFNGINFGNKPWVSTFEALLPRLGNSTKNIEKGIEALAKPNCKKLIAFSEFNFKMQQNYLRQNFSSYAEELMAKTEIILPPQPIINQQIRQFNKGDVFRVLFVGNDFFRKGGRELFHAVDLLSKKGANIQLDVVSLLTTDNFVTHTTEVDKKLWKQKLSSASFCRYNGYLPNSKVLELMKESHVLALPTMQDTFGYVVLEAQATALPVISSSIRALPEINNEDCGWIIDVPQNERGMADIHALGYKTISEVLMKGLISKLTNILENPQQIEQKSGESLKRIKDSHDEKVFSEKLTKIYKGALNA